MTTYEYRRGGCAVLLVEILICILVLGAIVRAWVWAFGA